METFACNKCLQKCEHYRFKCLKCVDFDLCESCISFPDDIGLHDPQTHTLVKFCLDDDKVISDSTARNEFADQPLSLESSSDLLVTLSILDALEVFHLNIDMISRSVANVDKSNIQGLIFGLLQSPDYVPSAIDENRLKSNSDSSSADTHNEIKNHHNETPSKEIWDELFKIADNDDIGAVNTMNTIHTALIETALSNESRRKLFDRHYQLGG